MINIKVNPEQQLVAECLEKGLTNVPVTQSPLARQIQQMVVSAGKGEILLQFELGEQFTQGNGVIQGGAANMTLDAGLAFSALTMLSEGQSIVTLNLHTQFFRPVMPGKVWVRAKVEKPGRSVMFCSAELLDKDDKVLATAESPLMVINL